MTNEQHEKMKDLMAGFDESLVEAGRSKNTREAYHRDVMQLVTLHGDPREWTTSIIELYKEKMLADKLAPSSMNRKLVAIRRFIMWSNASGTSIHANVRLLRVQKQEFLGETITTANIEKMVACATAVGDKLAVAIFLTLGRTGCRVSELLQWRVRDIGSDSVQVVGKGKIRDVLVPDNLRYYLSDYAGQREDPDQFLFINTSTGEPLTRQRIDQIIKQYARAARVPRKRAHAHSFRHQYGIALTDDNVKIEDVAELMGHGNINTTKIYTRSTRKTLQNHLNKLGKPLSYDKTDIKNRKEDE